MSTELTGHQEPQLQDYLRPVLTRAWLILGLVAIVTAGTYFYYASQPKQYVASTSIFVASSDNALALLDPSYTTYGSERDTANQATLLLSEPVAAKVARRVGFKGDPGSLLGGVTAKPSADSDIITITTNRPNPRQAAVVANAFAQEFIDSRATRRRGVAKQALVKAQQQLAQVPRTRANDEARATLEQNIRRLTLVTQLPTGNTEQLDAAVPPIAPVAPKPERNAIFAFVLSLLAAVGLAFGLERFDRRLKRLEDIESLYDLPIIAVIPHSEQMAAFEGDEAVVANAIREPLRQLRTNLELASLDRPLRRILVTSAIPGEGKSTVVRNLAIVYREWGQRVIVVDADLRRPSLARLFDIDGTRGLTDVLAGDIAVEEARVEVPVHVRGLRTLEAIQTTDAPAGANGGSIGTTVASSTVTVLPAGPAPANPQAILAASRTASLFDELAGDCDVMLLDSPPMLAVGDAVSLMNYVDAVILVARLGFTVKDTAKHTLEALRRVPGVNVVGVVANDLTSFEGGNYRYGYYRAYGDAD